MSNFVCFFVCSIYIISNTEVPKWDWIDQNLEYELTKLVNANLLNENEVINVRVDLSWRGPVVAHPWSVVLPGYSSYRHHAWPRNANKHVYNFTELSVQSKLSKQIIFIYSRLSLSRIPRDSLK